MPKPIKQSDTCNDIVPRLLSQEEARRELRCSWNRWYEIKSDIPVTVIGKREFYTPQSLAAFLRASTRKPKARHAERPAA